MSNKYDSITRDLNAIYDQVGLHARRIALFGSVLRQDTIPNDVDILIEVLPGCEEQVRDQLLCLTLSIPITQLDLVTYDKGYDEKRAKPGYHIILCPITMILAFLNKIRRHDGQYAFIKFEDDLTKACI